MHLAGGATVIRHTRQSAAGSADAALGAQLMDGSRGGVHRFLFTIARSKTNSCTGLRVGIASADGSHVCAIKPWDGALYTLPPEGGHGDPRCALPHLKPLCQRPLCPLVVVLTGMMIVHARVQTPS